MVRVSLQYTRPQLLPRSAARRLPGRTRPPFSGLCLVTAVELPDLPCTCPFTPPLPFKWPSGVVGQTLGLCIVVALLTVGVSLLWIGSAADNDQIFVTSYCRLFWGVWSLLGCSSFRPSEERRFGGGSSRSDGLSACKLGCPAFPWSPPYHGSAPVPCWPCAPMCRRLF